MRPCTSTSIGCFCLISFVRESLADFWHDQGSRDASIFPIFPFGLHFRVHRGHKLGAVWSLRYPHRPGLVRCYSDRGPRYETTSCTGRTGAGGSFSVTPTKPGQIPAKLELRQYMKSMFARMEDPAGRPLSLEATTQFKCGALSEDLRPTGTSNRAGSNVETAALEMIHSP
jgi:hypothetical protein